MIILGVFFISKPNSKQEKSILLAIEKELDNILHNGAL